MNFTRAPERIDAMPNTTSIGWTLIFSAWLIATVSTLGALFLGEVMGNTPCVLCWYQRIAMFPLVLVLAAGLFPFDPRVVRYALPLALAGLGLALFHLALIAGWIPESIKPCQQGVPCSNVTVVWFGFVTIPLLSVLSFSLVVALLLTTYFKGSK
ncbi:MAG: disulfide bond formation protein B [Gallionella sp.]